MTFRCATRQLTYMGVDVKSGDKGSHDRGLLLIGLFKLSKSIFFFCIGLGAIRYLHKDLGDEVQRLVTALHFDTESHFIEFLLKHADAITPHRLKEIGIGTFAYSAIALIEGIGLMKEKVWAEYLTLTLTISFLPWETYEIIRHISWFRVGMMAANVVVLLYLLWIIGKKREERRRAAIEGNV